MNHQITRTFEFDAAHRVLGHASKCRFLHGHRYRAEVTVESSVLDSLGMVIDFSCIKEKVGSWIDSHFDHNSLFHKDDPILGFSPEVLLQIMGGRMPYVLDCNPTAENIASLLLLKSMKLLSPLKVTRVKVWETPNCLAEVFG